MMKVFNNSRLALFERCKRRFYWREIRGIVPADGPADYLVDGTAGHAALRALYTDGHMHQAFNNAWGLTQRVEAALSEEEREAIQERAHYFHRLLNAYVDHYKEEEYEVIGGETRFQVEHEVGGDKVLLVGQVDLLILNDWGQVGVMDHKFLKAGGAGVMDAFEESSQFTQYMWGVAKTLGREVTFGVANVIVKLKEIAKRGQPFNRTEIMRTQADYDGWLSDVSGTIKDIWWNETMAPSRAWRRNPGACHTMGLCPYYSLCWPTPTGDWTEPPLLATFVARPPGYVEDAEAAIAEEVAGG